MALVELPVPHIFDKPTATLLPSDKVSFVHFDSAGGYTQLFRLWGSCNLHVVYRKLADGMLVWISLQMLPRAVQELNP